MMMMKLSKKRIKKILVENVGLKYLRKKQKLMKKIRKMKKKR